MPKSESSTKQKEVGKKIGRLMPGDVLKAKDPLSQLLVISADKTRRKRFTAKYIETFFKKTQVITIRCGEITSRDLATFREATQSLALFSDRQVVLLSEVDGLRASDNKEIVDILGSSTATTYVVASASSLPVASVLYKYFDKRGALLKFEPLKGFELKRWAARECQQDGIVSISDRALELIIDNVQGDIDTLVPQIRLLSLYSGDQPVSEQTLLELFKFSTAHSEFAFVDVLLSGDKIRAKILLAELIREGKNPFGLIAILARNFSHLLIARLELDRGNTEAGVRELLGVSPWQFNKIMSHARNVSTGKIKKVTAELMKADMRLKNRSIAVEDILLEVII